MPAGAVKAALASYYAARAGEWVTIEEALDGWANGFGGIDLLALGVWKTAKVKGLQGVDTRATAPGNARVAHEVKVSRTDFRKELYGYKPGPDALAGFEQRVRDFRARGSRGEPPRPPRESPAWPDKQLRALAISDYFVFVTPRGLLHEDEATRYHPWGDNAPRPGALWVPAEAGLWEVDHNGVTVVRSAPRREGSPLTRHETHELIRKALAA